jgi:hypothetical protein
MRLGFALAAALVCTWAHGETPFYADKLDLLHYIDADGIKQPVTSITDWQIRREHLKANMHTVMGPFVNADQRPPFDTEVLEEIDFPTYTRKKITFAVEDKHRLSVFLLVPKNLTAPAPAMVCPHPTYKHGKNMVVGLGNKPNRNYAEELAQRGYVTIAPDYPTFGEEAANVYALGYQSATAKGIWNHMRCVDFLQSLPEVSDDRIGAIGHSLGGHNTLFLGLFDKRVKVMVTSCGFNRFTKYMEGNLTGWSHDGYMPRIKSVYNVNPARMPFDFTEILGALAPRPVYINAPVDDDNFEVTGVYDCVNAARPIYELYDAAEKLKAVHPTCGHDFPADIREEAYAFIDAALQHPPE